MLNSSGYSITFSDYQLLKKFIESNQLEDALESAVCTFSSTGNNEIDGMRQLTFFDDEEM